MKLTLPVLAGSVVLLAGLGVTWLVATSSYFLACRLAVEVDLYSCWALTAIPLGLGIGSVALGGTMLARGILSSGRRRYLGFVQSERGMFLTGVLSISILWVSGLLFFVRYLRIGLNFYFLTFLVFSVLLASLGFEWVRTYVASSRTNTLTSETSPE